MRSSGRGVAGVVVGLVALLIMVGLPLVAAGPATALEGIADPAHAPFVCGSSGIENHAQEKRFAKVYFPAGATATMTLSMHDGGTGGVIISAGLSEIDTPNGSPGVGSGNLMQWLGGDQNIPNYGGWTWTNSGPSRYMLLNLYPETFGQGSGGIFPFWSHLQLMMSSDNNCAAPRASEHSGCNKAEPGASNSQGTACDPVNTQSGNFHQGS
jgi:hypothetical protein